MAAAAEPFELRDGDRLVLLGNTLIEREQKYGYWETALTSHSPDRNLVFRNLGWSGDTVFGEARAGFGSTADGFKRLREDVFAAKPTAIVLGYGGNEAFAGEAGLPRFRQGLVTLLDTLAPTKARLVLLSPLRFQYRGHPLPRPEAHNRQLSAYRDALRQTAEQRGHPFLDLFELLTATTPGPLTDNGMHLNAYGYWRSAAVLEERLGLPPRVCRIDLDATGQVKAERTRVTNLRHDPLRFDVTDAALPAPPPPAGSPAAAWNLSWQRVVRLRSLAPGQYTLKIDGQPVASAAANVWAEGVKLQRGPEVEQVERLRAAIVAKNELFFHRYRPQNDTYLFGFRKHEQGQNSREIPQFDPLIARAEADIARLRVPATHRYELVKEEGSTRRR